MDANPDQLSAADAAFHIHSGTNLQRLGEAGPVILTRGEGVHVYDKQGNKLIEAVSGLWCASLGFSERRLIDAAMRQYERLPYYHTYHGMTPDVTVKLAETLIGIAPKPLAKAMFAGSGSEANDTAIKLVWYYNNARGKPAKKKLIARKLGYHGVTIASGSLTGMESISGGFDLPIDRIRHTETPHHYRLGQPGESEEAFATRLAAELKALIQREGADTIGAFVAEPVMGAGGVIVPPRTYFEKIGAVLRRHDILLIADEVICGFGRTGRMFGSELYGLAPDIMTLGKQLTGAYFPMSAILVSQAIFDTVAPESDRRGQFGHGFTYAGHPVGAAIALEAIRITREEDLPARAGLLGQRMMDGLAHLKTHPLVGEIRGVGLLAAVQLVESKEPKRFFANDRAVAKALVATARRHGIVVRGLPFNAIAFSPPLSSTEAEIDQIVDRFSAALDEFWRDYQRNDRPSSMA